MRAITAVVFGGFPSVPLCLRESYSPWRSSRLGVRSVWKLVFLTAARVAEMLFKNPRRSENRR